MISCREFHATNFLKSLLLINHICHNSQPNSKQAIHRVTLIHKSTHLIDIWLNVKKNTHLTTYTQMINIVPITDQFKFVDKLIDSCTNKEYRKNLQYDGLLWTELGNLQFLFSWKKEALRSWLTSTSWSFEKGQISIQNVAVWQRENRKRRETFEEEYFDACRCLQCLHS